MSVFGRDTSHTSTSLDCEISLMSGSSVRWPEIGLNLTRHTAAKPEYAVEAFFCSLTRTLWSQHEIGSFRD